MSGSSVCVESVPSSNVNLPFRIIKCRCGPLETMDWLVWTRTLREIPSYYVISNTTVMFLISK